MLSNQPEAGDHAPETITFLTNPSGRIVGWSAEAADAFGRATAEVLGSRCSALMAGRDLNGNVFCSEHCPVMVMALRGEEPHPTPLVFRIAERPEQVFELSITLLRGTERNPKILHRLVPVGGTGGREPAESLSRPPAKSAAPGSVAPAVLTSRELEILRVLSTGMTAEEAAQKLGISVATVRAHLRAIHAKLKVSNRASAVALAIRQGWL